MTKHIDLHRFIRQFAIIIPTYTDQFWCIMTIYRYSNNLQGQVFNLLWQFTSTVTKYIDFFWVIKTFYNHYDKLHWQFLMYYDTLQVHWPSTLTSFDLSMPFTITLPNYADQFGFIKTIYKYHGQAHSQFLSYQDTLQSIWQIKLAIFSYSDNLQVLWPSTLTSFDVSMQFTITIPNYTDQFGFIMTTHMYHATWHWQVLELLGQVTSTMTKHLDNFDVIKTLHNQYDKLHWPFLIYYNHLQVPWPITLISFHLLKPFTITMTNYTDKFECIRIIYNAYDQLHWPVWIY
jgi:hypothetical protein